MRGISTCGDELLVFLIIKSDGEVRGATILAWEVLKERWGLPARDAGRAGPKTSKEKRSASGKSKVKTGETTDQPEPKAHGVNDKQRWTFSRSLTANRGSKTAGHPDCSGYHQHLPSSCVLRRKPRSSSSDHSFHWGGGVRFQLAAGSPLSPHLMKGIISASTTERFQGFLNNSVLATHHAWVFNLLRRWHLS